MKVLLARRDFSDLAVQPKVDFAVIRYSHHVLGGPRTATITASGDPEALFELINHLRAPVTLLNTGGEAVWWGYLSELTINMPAVSYGVDLSTMFNRVSVAYTDQGIRYTTAWAQDDDSVSEYGKKEILLSLADVFEEGALQYRAIQLEQSHHPIPVLKFPGGKAGTATLTCLGWFETLEWMYYANPIGKEGYEETGKGGREIGEDDRPRLAQSFRLGSTSSWDAKSIWIRAWKAGKDDPTDSLVVSLRTNSGGSPGSVLASGQIAAANMSTSADWIEIALNATITLQPGTTYWIHIARSGAVSAGAYYMVDTNLDFGYPRGEIKLYNTNLGAWGEDIYGRWGDLLFIVMGSLDTTLQIGTIIEDCGQFLAGATIENQSGMASTPYRAGDRPALYELTELLGAGTANNRRLLCEITPERYLKLYEEPARPANPKNSFALNQDGELLSAALTPMDASLCPVGFWCRLHDVIPPSVDLSLVTDPNLFFVEEAEFDAENETYNILGTRSQVNAMDMGGVIPG